MSSSPYVRRLAVAVLCLLLGMTALAAQAAPAVPAPGSPAEDALPKLEQEKAENPISRFEIVSLGSYPITLFYVGFAFDLQRWFANGRDANYAPWPFNGGSSVALTDSQRLTRLGAALGVSFAVGAVDAIIHAGKVKAAERLREARLSIPPAAGPQAGDSATP
jgi:hypothetical protein